MLNQLPKCKLDIIVECRQSRVRIEIASCKFCLKSSISFPSIFLRVKVEGFSLKWILCENEFVGKLRNLNLLVVHGERGKIINWVYVVALFMQNL